MNPKTFKIKSFGCQMNVYDGDRMAELLAEQGITPAAEGADADLVVLNTCHIREKAAEKVYSDIGRLKREDGSSPLIAVAGCVAQAEGEEIMARAPSVKMVVGRMEQCSPQATRPPWRRMNSAYSAPPGRQRRR